MADSVLVLNGEDSKVFVDAILNPPEPNEVLKAAVKEYREYFERSGSER